MKYVHFRFDIENCCGDKKSSGATGSALKFSDVKNGKINPLKLINRVSGMQIKEQAKEFRKKLKDMKLN